ncbi:MAG: twin-arginine translocase subunit TatC [Deltaproteobacteria bacterium]|nr:twin-arginine translocase subunit TatC [Deltaproteobacteria bacterium]
MADEKLSFTAHLTELRTRLIRSFIAVAVGFLVSYAFVENIFEFLMRPMLQAMPPGSPLVFTSLTEGFFTYFKLALTSGICLASPVILYQLWRFIAPGLLEHEKRYALPFALSVTAFFIAGAAFCYYAVFPSIFKFLMSFSSDIVRPMPSIKEYLSFSSKLLLTFGLIFEYPPLVFFLAKVGILKGSWLVRQRKYAIVLIFVISAVITPPDVVSQILMALPMMVLYELGIVIAKVVGKKE